MNLDGTKLFLLVYPMVMTIALINSKKIETKITVLGMSIITFLLYITLALLKISNHI